jgi:hypothetical protein
MIDYDKSAKFVLDGVRFSYRGEIYKGQGFLEWDPAKGFHIDALLDKSFAPVDAFKTLGQIIVNTKEDTFKIWLNVRGQGRAFVPVAFPLGQKKSFQPDNHLSMKLQRIVFFSRWPHVNETPSRFWSGSADFLTKSKMEFPDHLKSETTLGGQPFEGSNSTGLFLDDDDNWCLTGRSISDDNFELSWALNKNRWRRNDAWRFGEAARRSLSIISAQTVWIARQTLSRDGQQIEDLRRRADAEKLSYYLWPLQGNDRGSVENWKFTKEAFLKLVDFFLRGGLHAETCWNIFCQMADASRQKNTQAKELLLATILEAIFRTIYNRPFQEGKSDPPRSKKLEMERFRKEFFSDKWTNHCSKALELHSKLRHRNAHPDWLTSQNGTLSKPELKKSYERQIFLSRFYGYMILGMAGFKDLEPLFPMIKFGDSV